MGKILAFLPKLLPFLPQLIDAVVKLFGLFGKKYKHDPDKLKETAINEVKTLQEHKSTAEEKDWNIVKGED